MGASNAARLRARLLLGCVVTYASALILPHFLLGHSVHRQFDGASVVVAEFIGCTLSLLCASVVVASYLKGPRAYQRHPNSLIVTKTACDAGLNVMLIVVAMLVLYNTRCREGMSPSKRRLCYAGVYAKACARYSILPFLTQLLQMASESWFLVLLVDLERAVWKPFYSFNSSRRLYKALAWLSAVFTAAVLILVSQPQLQESRYSQPWRGKVLSFDSCWLPHRRTTSLVAYGRIPSQLASFVLFYGLVFLIYCHAARTLHAVGTRLKRGLSSTFAVRVRVVAVAALTVLTYSTYWVVYLLLYATVEVVERAASIKEQQGDAGSAGRLHRLSLRFYATWKFHCLTKCWWDLVVWLLANDPTLLFQNKSSLTQPLLNDVDAPLRPQANEALQKELLYYVTSGIRQCSRYSNNGSTDDCDRPIYLQRCDMAEPVHYTLMGLIMLLLVDDDSNSILRASSVPRPSFEEAECKEELLSASMERHTSWSTRADLERSTSEAPVTNEEEVAIKSLLRNSNDEEKEEEEQPPEETTTTGSSLSPPCSSVAECISFTDFKPLTFLRIREHYGHCVEDCAVAFSTTQKERFTEGGSSNAFFFYSGDERYIVKSCTKEEFRTLLLIAESYADYVCDPRNRGTFLVRLLGAHCLRIYDSEFYFLVMENIFWRKKKCGTSTTRFDIKGSWVNRNMAPPRPGQRLTCKYCNRKYTKRKRRRQVSSGSSDSRSSSSTSAEDDFEVPAPPQRGRNEEWCPVTVGGSHEPNLVLKDNDLNLASRLRLEAQEAQGMLRQLQRDSALLADLGIMDYSFLLEVTSVEYPARVLDHEPSSPGSALESPPLHAPSNNNGAHRSHVVVSHFYVGGIVDVLQRWTMRKRVEWVWKSYFRGQDRRGVSSLPPDAYCARFQSKMADLLLPPSGDLQRPPTCPYIPQ